MFFNIRTLSIAVFLSCAACLPAFAAEKAARRSPPAKPAPPVALKQAAADPDIETPRPADEAQPKDDASKDGAKKESPKEKPAEKAEPRKQLTPAQTALRDRIRRTLGVIYNQPFNTRDNTVGEVLAFCQAFGCEAEIREGGTSSKKVNGITTLCWNLPCYGREPLMLFEGRMAPRVGYGYQESAGQMAAMLAFSRVPPEYPTRVGETIRTVADLIEHEKLSCRSGAEQSWRLIALSHYVHEPSWKNDLGEEWSLERLIGSELDRSVAGSNFGGMNRLLAMGYALHAHRERGRAAEGEFARAQRYCDEGQEFLLRGQNTDGSWGSPQSRDYASGLSSTALVLRWLAISLPDDRIEDARVVQAVQYVDNLLSSQRYHWNVPSLGARELTAVMTGCHALMLYDGRVFAPADLPPQAAPAKQARAKP